MWEGKEGTIMTFSVPSKNIGQHSHHFVLKDICKLFVPTGVAACAPCFLTFMDFSTSPPHSDCIGIRNGFQTGFRVFFTNWTTKKYIFTKRFHLSSHSSGSPFVLLLNPHFRTWEQLTVKWPTYQVEMNKTEKPWEECAEKYLRKLRRCCSFKFSLKTKLFELTKTLKQTSRHLILNHHKVKRWLWKPRL